MKLLLSLSLLSLPCGVLSAETVASCVSTLTFNPNQGQCHVYLSETQINNGSTGSNLSFSLDHPSVPAGTTPVTLHVHGDGGIAGCAIVDTCVTQVTVNDVENPTIQCMPHSQGYDMDPIMSMHMIPSRFVDHYSDNCAYEDVTLSFPGGIPTYGCEHVGTTQSVTLAATDESGNKATCAATVDVHDMNYVCSPTIASCLPTETVDTDPHVCFKQMNDDSLDNGSVGAGAVSFYIMNNDPGVGTTTIITEISSSSGWDSCTTDVTVVDNEPPTIDCFPYQFDIDPTYAMPLVSAPLAMVDDNCQLSTPPTVSFQGGIPPTFGCAEVDTVQTVTMVATDGAGNTATCDAHVTVTDHSYTCSPTVASCVSALTYDTTPGSCSKDLYGHETDFDDGGSTGAGQIFTMLMNSNPSVGTTSIMLEVSSSSGWDSCTTDVTVVDNELPTIVCNAAFTYHVGSSAPLTPFDIIYSHDDNCWDGLTTSLQAADISYGCSDVNSTYMVTGVVTDSSGNTATCDAQVTVVDTTGCCDVIGTVPTNTDVPRTESGPGSGPKSSESNGDPHFTTWKKEHYEFHGQCDLVMMSDPSFADDIGLDVHIRTKLVRFWSYIKTAAIRIGDDTLEIEGSDDSISNTARYWINYEYQGDLIELGGFPMTTFSSSPKKREYKIDLGSKYHGQVIVIKTFKEFVGVKVVNGSEEAFGKTIGMSGDFKTGNTLARDGATVLHDFSELGKEWQVLPSECKLFHQLEAPQFPERCIMPEDPRGERRRRLEESNITMDEAESACAGLKDAATIKDCVYDILATQDIDMVGAF